MILVTKIDGQTVTLPVNVNNGNMTAPEFLDAIKDSPFYTILGTGRLPGYTRKGCASIEPCGNIKHIYRRPFDATKPYHGANLLLRTHADGVQGGVSDVTYIRYTGALRSHIYREFVRTPIWYDTRVYQTWEKYVDRACEEAYSQTVISEDELERIPLLTDRYHCLLIKRNVVTGKLIGAYEYVLMYVWDDWAFENVGPDDIVVRRYNLSLADSDIKAIEKEWTREDLYHIH